MTSTSCKQRTIVLDIETYSSADLVRGGVAKYTEAEDFEILLMSYCWDDEPVELWDFTADGTPPWLAEVLLDSNVLKVAWNIPFERTCFNKALGIYTPPEQWRDAMTLAAMNGLPMTLEGAGAALQMDKQKLTTGKALINYFCKPCKPTLANGGRTRNLPHHNPEKWEDFKTYCLRDTDTERDIYKRLLSFPVPDWERKVEYLDARINERGVLVDTELAEAAVHVDEAFKAEHTDELRRLTGLDNPNSVTQLKEWLVAVGVPCETLDKAAVSELLKRTTDKTTKRVLQLRQLLGKTSTKKYQAMLDSACADHRVRGITQYYGAGRTGRWAGRRVQLQNLAQNHLDDIGTVREIVRGRDLETLELCYNSVPGVLSQLIRTALIAKPGHTFLVADYAAIEARVIAWMAGEQWRMDLFAKGGDIYCSSASQIFKVPVEKHGINGHLRQRGKVAELACGYGGGVNAMRNMDNDHALDDLTDSEVKQIVEQWRAASPRIPNFWRKTEAAAVGALQTPGKTYKVPGCNVKYWRDADALRCQLPSGRILTYWGARLEGRQIVFWGLQAGKDGKQTKKWQKLDTWGGKLVENIVQAVARDCLAVALLRLDQAGYAITFHVHDEVIVEAPEGTRWQDVAEVMGRPISWAPGLLLRGDGYETTFYMKD